MTPSLDDWVWVEAMLHQAMLGVLSTNVRQVCLAYKNGWEIMAVLEQPCEHDADDIQDIADETSILIEEIKARISPAAHALISTSVIHSVNPLENPNSVDCRIVFRRKEVTPGYHSASIDSA